MRHRAKRRKVHSLRLFASYDLHRLSRYDLVVSLVLCLARDRAPITQDHALFSYLRNILPLAADVVAVIKELDKFLRLAADSGEYSYVLKILPQLAVAAAHGPVRGALVRLLEHYL